MAPEAPRVPGGAGLKVAAFDWDGTLVHFNGLKPNYEDDRWLLRHTKPYHTGLKRARNLIEHGTEVHIVTGRGDHTRTATLLQVRQGLDPDFPPNRLHNSPHMPREFPGYAALRRFKAGILRSLEAELYVGDHQEADCYAAKDAGVPFMDAAQFRAGYPFPVGPAWVQEPLLGVV